MSRCYFALRIADLRTFVLAALIAVHLSARCVTDPTFSLLTFHQTLAYSTRSLRFSIMSNRLDNESMEIQHLFACWCCIQIVLLDQACAEAAAIRMTANLRQHQVVEQQDWTECHS